MRYLDLKNSVTCKWIIVWLILPNIPFLMFWLLGGPPRYAAIGLYYGVGILSTALSFSVVVVIYLAAVCVDLAFFASNTFNLSVKSLLESLVYIKNLNIAASKDYVIFGSVLAFSVPLTLYFYRKWQHDIRKISLLPVTVAVLVLCAVDSLLQFTTNYHIGQYLPRSDGFNSAVLESDFEAHLQLDKPDKVLFVMIEGWGVLRNTDYHKRILGELSAEQLPARYEFLEGTAPFFGSTTAAEIRELCGSWDEYGKYMDSRFSECLPHKMKGWGYDTYSIHGFTKEMFQRNHWYPNIGFIESEFLEDLWLPSLGLCEGVFTGICDTDIAEHINSRLGSGGEKQFVYWLTLNSHLPIHPNTLQEHYACNGSTSEFGSHRICMIANVWSSVFKSIESILDTEAGEKMSVLIVGDHSPPYWGRHEKSYFLPDRIPWILIKPKASISQ